MDLTLHDRESIEVMNNNKNISISLRNNIPRDCIDISIKVNNKSILIGWIPNYTDNEQIRIVDSDRDNIIFI